VTLRLPYPRGITANDVGIIVLNLYIFNQIAGFTLAFHLLKSQTAGT
jgi:hypothetical protein